MAADNKFEIYVTIQPLCRHDTYIIFAPRPKSRSSNLFDTQAKKLKLRCSYIFTMMHDTCCPYRYCPRRESRCSFPQTLAGSWRWRPLARSVSRRLEPLCPSCWSCLCAACTVSRLSWRPRCRYLQPQSNEWFHNRLRSFASDHTGRMAASMAAAICTQTADRHATTDSHVGNKASWAFAVNCTGINATYAFNRFGRV